MKGLIAYTSIALLLTHTVLSNANPIPMTIINNSGETATVNIANNQNQSVNVGAAQVKMLNAEFKYPTSFFVGGGRFSRIQCEWLSPLIGKQTVRNIILTISQNPAKNCLVEWR